jgi:hypothetical protein
MSKFYTEEHRALQDRFDARRMADMMEHVIVHSAFTEQESAFIQSLDMFCSRQSTQLADQPFLRRAAFQDL